MTKTKRQLRAEAVERLKEYQAKGEFSVHNMLDAVVGDTNWTMESDALIDLLKDDELPEGDAPSDFAEILMSLAADCSCMGDGIVRHFEPKDVQNDVDALMRVVERDYVSREYLDEVRSEADYREGLLHESIDDLEAERDELKKQMDILHNAIREGRKERDEWRAKAEQAQESYLDAKSDRDAWMEKAMDAHESCRQYADQPKCEEAPDCESDSREKLEADVRRWFTGDYYDDYYSDADMCEIVSGWLDRQAAIDERYWKSQVDALVSKGEMLADGNTRLWNEIAELQEKADEQRKSLEAAWEDNAELTDQLESAHAKKRALKAHISKMQEGRHGWHIKGKELQKKVDALTQANGDLRDEWHRVCVERNKLISKLIESERDRESLRAKLGEAVDRAHEIGRLME